MIEKILTHLGMWAASAHSPPVASLTALWGGSCTVSAFARRRPPRRHSLTDTGWPQFALDLRVSCARYSWPAARELQRGAEQEAPAASRCGRLV